MVMAEQAFRRWQIGAARITRVLELDTMTLPADLLLEASAEMAARHSWLQPDFATPEGFLHFNVQAFIVEAGELRIMVDPCLGNHKPRVTALYNMLNGPFLDRLSDAGFPPENIDVVLCTHLHADHVGWNTRLEGDQWVPTFPNARYLFARTEFEHAKVDTMIDQEATYLDSVKPIVDAGLADLVEMDHRICAEVSLVPTPGHTPGHCSIRVVSEGVEALISGDMIHHPIQIAEPDVCTHSCWNKEMTRATRRSLFEETVDTGALLLGSHFPDPTGVAIVSAEGGWRAVPW
jgi:glyoxylase-like metal-dependent hydrolase (beta-lactamase superfamily II)